MSDEYLHQLGANEVSTQRAFLLGVAASAIAFAIHETSDRSLSWSLLPIAAAVAAWSLSFAGGILHSHSVQIAIAANKAQNYAEKVGDPEDYRRARESFRRANKTAARRYKLQLWSLLAGAIFYIVGQAMHMAENDRAPRTPSTAVEAPKLVTKPNPGNLSQEPETTGVVQKENRK